MDAKKIFAAVTLFAMVAGPALAHGWPPIGQDIQVTNVNFANVTNNVTVGAFTGDNVTVGGDGGNGGFACKGSANGGAGGSNSGDIITGAAYAEAKVVNKVNTNITKVGVNCVNCQDTDDVIVKNMNMANVGNGVGVGADTSDNYAVGGNGGKGGFTFGGSANGGAGGSNSGDITTGGAYAGAKVINVVNTNITRVRKY
jgi:hypothetical protein